MAAEVFHHEHHGLPDVDLGLVGLGLLHLWRGLGPGGHRVLNGTQLLF